METTLFSGTRPSPLSDSSEDEFDNGGYPPVDMESKLLNHNTQCIRTADIIEMPYDECPTAKLRGVHLETWIEN